MDFDQKYLKYGLMKTKDWASLVSPHYPSFGSDVSIIKDGDIYKVDAGDDILFTGSKDEAREFLSKLCNINMKILRRERMKSCLHKIGCLLITCSIIAFFIVLAGRDLIKASTSPYSATDQAAYAHFLELEMDPGNSPMVIFKNAMALPTSFSPKLTILSKLGNEIYNMRVSAIQEKVKEMAPPKPSVKNDMPIKNDIGGAMH